MNSSSEEEESRGWTGCVLGEVGFFSDDLVEGRRARVVIFAGKRSETLLISSSTDGIDLYQTASSVPVSTTSNLILIASASTRSENASATIMPNERARSEESVPMRFETPFKNAEDFARRFRHSVS